MKRSIIFSLVLILFSFAPLVAAQEPEKPEASNSVIVEQESHSEQERDRPLSQAAVKNKERASRALEKKCAVTIKLKQGAVFYYIHHGPDIKHVAGKKEKIAGRIEGVGEKEFWIGERDITGWQYLTKRVRYEDVEEVHFNLIPNGSNQPASFYITAYSCCRLEFATRNNHYFDGLI